jgi:polyisoprenoid-binding protein YceI
MKIWRWSLLALWALMAWPRGAQAKLWDVDAQNSSLTFTATQGENAFTGGFKRFTPIINFNAQNLDESKITVTIDMTSAYAGSRDRDEALPTAPWFDSGRFPEAVFETQQIRAVISDKGPANTNPTMNKHVKKTGLVSEPTGEAAYAAEKPMESAKDSENQKGISSASQNYEADAKLTIRGVTRDLLVPFTLMPQGDGSVARGAVTIARQDFGVGQGEFATDRWIKFPVTINFVIQARPKTSPLH